MRAIAIKNKIYPFVFSDDAKTMIKNDKNLTEDMMWNLFNEKIPVVFDSLFCDDDDESGMVTDGTYCFDLRCDGFSIYVEDVYRMDDFEVVDIDVDKF